MGCSTPVLSHGHRKPLRGIRNINDARIKFMSWLRGLLLPDCVCWWLSETLLEFGTLGGLVDPLGNNEHSGFNQLKAQHYVKLQGLCKYVCFDFVTTIGRATGLITPLNLTSFSVCCPAVSKLSFHRILVWSSGSFSRGRDGKTSAVFSGWTCSVCLQMLYCLIVIPDQILTLGCHWSLTGTGQRAIAASSLFTLINLPVQTSASILQWFLNEMSHLRDVLSAFYP